MQKNISEYSWIYKNRNNLFTNELVNIGKCWNNRSQISIELELTINPLPILKLKLPENSVIFPAS